MKRSCIALMAAAVLLSGCASAEYSQQETHSLPEATASAGDSAAVSEESRETNETIGQTSASSESAESAQSIPEEQKSPEQERLEALILDAAGNDGGKQFFSEVFGDLDGDGTEELYAFYGIDSDFYRDCYSAELYFASGDSVQKLLDIFDYSPLDQLLAEGDILVTTEQWYATGSISKVFAVRESRAVPVTFGFEACMGIHHLRDNEYVAYHSTYDMSGNIGHTWKPYWYYYSREELKFIPFSAHEITHDEFMALPDAAEADELLQRDSGGEYTLLMFDNGVVCANFCVDNTNLHYTWRVEDDGLALISPGFDGGPAEGRYVIPQDYVPYGG